MERFFREAAILSQLDHPHIVKYYDSGRVGSFIYFAMELVEGTDADRLMEAGALSVRMATRLICQLLKALDYAHARGFVHRDIKPSNILIQKYDDKRIVKLADFGLARAYQSSQMSGLTLQGEIRGTIPFMAPEQATHLRKVQPAADQYSAAATLYNLLTGQFPHEFPQGSSAPQQVIHIVTEKPVPIRRRRPDIPEALGQIIHRALSREPEYRYPDVVALRRALKPFAE
jgi:serine/threonine-protein kinase